MTMPSTAAKAASGRPASASREIKSVLTTVTYPEHHMKTLREALAPAEVIQLDRNDSNGISRALQTVDMALLAGDLDERYLDAPHLKWVHCDHAGLNKSARPGVFEKDLIVTGSAGRAAPALAQHIFFLAMALAYDFENLAQMKKDHDWTGVNLGPRRCMWGKTIGIIGHGHTGEQTAALAKAYGMKVLAYGNTDRPTPENVDRYYSNSRGDSIDEILRQADVVALTIRLTDQTYHMIGKRELEMMKSDTILINMARGSVVDEAALVEALHAGIIAGAGLDVFETEPLPADAPIWDAPNTVITPHATAEMPDLQGRSLEIILENIARYRQGRPMLNQAKPTDVYTR